MKGYLVHKDGKTYRIRKDGMWDMRYKASKWASKVDKDGFLVPSPIVSPVKLAYKHSAWEVLRPFLIPILVTIILGASYQAWVRYNENPDNWVTVVSGEVTRE